MRHTRFELQRIYLCMRMGSDDPERMAFLMGHVKNRMKSRQSDRVTNYEHHGSAIGCERKTATGGWVSACHTVNWAEKAAIAALMIDGNLSRKAAIKAFLAAAEPLPSATAAAGDAAGASAESEAVAAASDAAGGAPGSAAGDGDVGPGAGDVAAIDDPANDIEYEENADDVDAQFALNLVAAGVASVGEDGLEISGDGIRILTGESGLPQQESADAAGSDDAPAAADALDAALAAIEAEPELRRSSRATRGVSNRWR